MPRQRKALSQHYMIMLWKGSGWTLYKVHKRKHGNPPANDLSEVASENLGTLEVRVDKRIK